MRSCAACGGLIGEPGKAYGYAGRWCHCTKPLPNDYPHVQWFPHIREGIMPPKTLEDLAKSPLTPINTTTTFISPPVATLTPGEFVHWLRGYFAAGGPNTLNQADFKRIAEELKRVHT